MSGVGLGWRPEIGADLLRQQEIVDFVEIVAESCFARPTARREARALCAIWPVIPHGVKLSLAGADPIDADRARALGKLAREVGAPLITEHAAFVHAAGREIGHLTAPPYTRAAVAALERNVTRARRHLPDVPLALENVVRTFRWPDDEMGEGDFYCEVVRRTGCPLLLDVGNLYANAVNAGVDPATLAAAFPLERVAMIHLAGGAREDGFYFDDHAHAIGEGVFSLLATVLLRTGAVPILIERDAAFPPFAELAAELTRCRGMLGDTTTRPPLATRPSPPPADTDDLRALGLAQAEVARLLAAPATPARDEVLRFGPRGIERSRGILRRKRVDEALAMLPLLSRERARLATVAATALAATRRPARFATISDAWRIAERALGDLTLAPLARRELLVLRSRFVRDGSGSVRPRRGPFIGGQREGEKRVWALKGPGARAPVRIIERAGKP